MKGRMVGDGWMKIKKKKKQGKEKEEKEKIKEWVIRPTLTLPVH